MPKDFAFAGYPMALICSDKTLKRPIKQLLWGDYVRITGEPDGVAVPVASRGKVGWIHKDSLQKERLLEVAMIDVGQGDGCLVVTPQDKHMLIDAGMGDNMSRFLGWRYNRFRRSNRNGKPASDANPFEFESMVMTHPDADHYSGFDALFKNSSVHVKTLYHNGIFERNTKGEELGPVTKVGRQKYITGLVRDAADLDALLAQAAAVDGKKYVTMVGRAWKGGRVGNIEMLAWKPAAGDRYLPGYGPKDPLSIRVLGPVLEPVKKGTGLRDFGDKSHTKNGHSIVLQLRYKNVSLLLGGDLNIPAEELLLEKHTGLPLPSGDRVAGRAQFIRKAREVFGSDIAKACHHGSADFSSLFLEVVNPIATLISSGDDEPYAHPRADSLGTTGRFGRGNRPLIFSTEVSRSSKDRITHPFLLRQAFREAFDAMAVAQSLAERTRARKKANQLVDKNIERSVAVYGAIQVRTDGEKVVIAYKVEAPVNPAKGWDIYQLESPSKGTPLLYRSKFEETPEGEAVLEGKTTVARPPAKAKRQSSKKTAAPAKTTTVRKRATRRKPKSR